MRGTRFEVRGLRFEVRGTRWEEQEERVGFGHRAGWYFPGGSVEVLEGAYPWRDGKANHVVEDAHHDVAGGGRDHETAHDGEEEKGGEHERFPARGYVVHLGVNLVEHLGHLG